MKKFLRSSMMAALIGSALLVTAHTNMLSLISTFSNWRAHYDAAQKLQTAQDERAEMVYENAVQEARMFGVPFTEYEPALISLARYKTELGKFEEAQQILLGCAEIDRESGREGAYENDLRWLFTAYQSQYIAAEIAHHNEGMNGVLEQAHVTLGNLLSVTKSIHGSQSVEVADLIMLRSWIREKQNHVALAIRNLDEAMEMLRKLETDGEMIAEASYDKARLLQKQNRNSEAIALYHDVLKFREAHLNCMCDRYSWKSVIAYAGLTKGTKDEPEARRLVKKLCDREGICVPKPLKRDFYTAALEQYGFTPTTAKPTAEPAVEYEYTYPNTVLTACAILD